MERKLLFVFMFLLIGSANAQMEKDLKEKGLYSISVSTSAELRAAVKKAKPGHIILIKPGIYNFGFNGRTIKGTKTKPIIIEGSDLKNPPVFTGGSGECIKLSNVEYVKIANLKIAGFLSNSINIDDGGKKHRPSHHIAFENLTIINTGNNGNQDAIKMSGVQHFVIKDTILKGWGGSAIDLVGCHNGIIQACLLSGDPKFRNKNGVQIKGGSSNILVQNSVLIKTGSRAINIGGSTGEKYFRPENTDYEAKNIIVAGNKFIGSEAQIAWVTSMSTYVHHNIFYLPDKFLGRILQESTLSKFKPCQHGIFEANLVVTDQRVINFINVGIGTAPETFSFINNAWYRFDSKKRPALPTREKDGVYGVYPELVNFGKPDMYIASKDKRLAGVGPSGYNPFIIKSLFADINIPDVKKILPVKASNNYSGQIIISLVLVLLGFIITIFRYIQKKSR